MKRTIIIAALALVAAASLSAAAQASATPSARTVSKSATVGSADGKMLTCKDLVGSAIRPSATRYYWTPESELTEKLPAPGRRPFRLPESDDTEVSFGKVPSRNEFGIKEGWFLSPDGASVAVYRVDESRVTSFPLLDISSRTGSLKSVKYPMNGMASERVDLCICDTLGNIRCTLNVNEFTDERYLAGVSWTPDSRALLVQVLDRSQHHLKMNLYDAADGSLLRTLFEEHNDAWVEPKCGVSFLKGTQLFIYTTDNRDGFRQLYLCDLDGGIRRLTACNADVSYLANDGEYVWYTSAEVSPVENHLFRVRLKKNCKQLKLSKIKIGAAERLTSAPGWHGISMSPDCRSYVDAWSSLDVPGRALLCSADGKPVRELYEAPSPMEPFAPVTVELGTVPSADPSFVNYYRLVKPADFDPARKYPLIVYVYGGPHSQMVSDSWLGKVRYWELLMAQKGYVLYIQDNRGTDNRGTAFTRAINRRCGEAESEDQVAGLKELIAEGWVDEGRVGVVGWSYGGFMTLTLATRYPELFKVAAAGGPVIDWKWYEVMYGERYMDTPETNPEGFAATSLVDKAPLLKARLLVCQGMNDSTVLPINSLSFMQSCVENNVVASYYPYPKSVHNVTGKWREHLFLLLTDFFEANL